MNTSVRCVRHVGIVVSDIERSLRFYRDLLGMEVWADFWDDSQYIGSLTGIANANVRMVKLRAHDGGSIELLQYTSHPEPVPTPSRSSDVGCNHVALQVDDVDALHRKLTDENIEFNSPPLMSPDGGAIVAYCRDPEGVIIELVEILEK